MAPNQLMETPVQGIHIQSAHQSQCARYVVEGAIRLELIQEPQPLLSKRLRQNLVTRHRRQGWDLPPRLSQTRRLDSPGKRFERRTFKERTQRHFDLKEITDTREHPSGQQGVS